MTRTVQPAGTRGSMKWIQRCVNQFPDLLNDALLPRLNGAAHIHWLSPLREDAYAEYRDSAFLHRVGHPHVSPALQDFWPRRGPQWDALGRSDKGDVLLVEAKAHIPELHSSPSAASAASLLRIQAALAETAAAFGAPADADWHTNFYQYANRLAHLYLLRREGVAAWLVLVSFVGDQDMRGPSDAAAWEAAYETVHATLGIRQDAPLLAHVVHVFPDVRALA